MKICFVGPSDSAHIVKWCKWFVGQGHEVHVISFSDALIDGAFVHDIDLKVDTNGSDLQKLIYLTSGKKIKRIVNDISPEIVNVHYATSYGTAVALSGLQEYVLSIWGSDIYDFPKKSIFHKYLLEFSLKKAPHLFSTSKAMADEASKYTNKPFVITPFGVDLELFNPSNRSRSDDESFVVGTVKGLSDKYGVRDILGAVSIVRNTTKIPIVLRIAGKGAQEQEYHHLTEELGISDITHWLGFISQEQAAFEWANMDLALIPSVSESFGVSAVEAQACGIAVIISNIPGLMEATNPGHSSVVVKRNDPNELANAIIDLYENPAHRKELSIAGRKYVEDNYELNHCFRIIEDEYYKMIGSKG